MRTSANRTGAPGTAPDGRVSLFEALPAAEWARTFGSLSIRDYPDKRVIYLQGEQRGSVFVIASGHVKLSRVNEHGNEFTVAILSKGEMFGPMVWGHGASEAHESAMAKGTTRLYQLPPDELVTALQRHPAFARGVIAMLDARRQALVRKVESLVFKEVKARLAETLQGLSAHYAVKCTHGMELDFRLTQQELADLIGTSRPVVSTILNDLRARGILSYNREFLCINKIEDLSDLAKP